MVAHFSLAQGLAGFFAAIGLYNTLIYFVTGDRAFLWYALLMDSLAGVEFVFTPNLIGMGGEALLVYRVGVFAVFFTIEAIFSWTFLRLNVRSPRDARIVAITLAANLLALGLSQVFAPSAIHRGVDHLLFLGLLAACALPAWSGASLGQEDSRYYFIGFGALFAGSLASGILDLASMQAAAQICFQVGVFAQAALLTLALASRYFKLDPLTGVKSRRAFDEGLPRAWRAATGSRTGLAVIVVAIHALKEYEARHGRMAGDSMMRRVANLCAGCCRDRADVFARYGDEAFAAIIPRVSRAEADAIAARMRDLVEETCQITIGVGVASIDEAHSSKGLIQRAARRSARDAIGRADVPDTAAL